MGQSPLDEFDQAMGSFVRGDANAAASLWLPAEDVTIFGAFGGYERGWAAVRPRLAWAASQFRDGTWACEHLAAHFGADVGYTVGIEHARASIGGSPGRQDLRVTHLYRRVDGRWQMVHRHADPLTGKAAPPAR
ncbi:MAG: nuclear transport factor 2 family protein [Trebonia sp.]|uniref:YybH family protein n=1 Tax=Trebonia sp. TaxID=2767075 RepID=UPI003BB0A036